MKKIIPYVILAAVCIAIMLFPVKTSAEYIRIEFTGNEDGELRGEECTLFYATASPDAFNEDESISCPIDNEKHYVEFKLEGKCNKNVKGLRLDFPVKNQVFSIGGVYVKSAGVLQKRYDPCVVFAPENIKQQNCIPELHTIKDGKIVYIATVKDDPYIIFSDEMTASLTGHFSHYLVTKGLICLFIIACFFSYKMDFFGLKKECTETARREGENHHEK